MEKRIDYRNVLPDASRLMAELDRLAGRSGIEPSLVELVTVRASQINRSAYCIDMHTKNARSAGETEQRLYELDAWRGTDLYTERERAALAWTEAVTLVNQAHVPDDVYEKARKSFSESELVALTMAIIVINGWNRLSIAFRRPAGTYQVHDRAA